MHDHRNVIFTAITANYDPLLGLPRGAFGDSDRVAFLDESTSTGADTASGWSVLELEPRSSEPCRSAKYYKVLSHEVFPDHEFSLWVDGAVRVDFSGNMSRLVEDYLGDRDLCIFNHPSRNCVYQEEQACLDQRKDRPELIRGQVDRYRAEGYPANAGMVEASVILRRHTEAVREFNEAWWQEIAGGSRRDQLSFNYCARRLGLQYATFPLSLRVDNGLFRRTRHRNELEMAV